MAKRGPKGKRPADVPKALADYLATVSVYPNVYEFAEFMHICEDTLYEWAKTDEEISESITKIKKVQQLGLVRGGLEGILNPTITKLILSCNHGMSEQARIDHTTQGEKVGVTLNFGVATDKDASAYL